MEGNLVTTMDQGEFDRPLFRSYSMGDRHTARMDKTNRKQFDKRQSSHSLDRSFGNSYHIATFNEYVYYDNGFRRFKGVSSLLMQNLGKDIDNTQYLGLNMDCETGRCVNEETNCNGDSRTDVHGILCVSNDKDFQKLDATNGNPVQTNRDLDGNRDTPNSGNSGKQRRTKPLMRRWTLYDRERKPHYCSHHAPPEPTARPSAWSYGGKKSDESNTPRKHSHSERTTCINGDSNSNSFDQLHVCSRKISQSRSVSSTSSEFDFDAVINGTDIKEAGTINTTETNSTGTLSLTEYNVYSPSQNGDHIHDSSFKPSLIPRPVRTYSFSSNTTGLNSYNCYPRVDGTPQRKGVRRAASMCERRSDLQSPRSANITPIRYDRCETRTTGTQLVPVFPKTSVENNSLVNKLHSISISEDEDGYPEPTPPTRAKCDIFHARDFIQIDEHSQHASDALLDSFDELVEYLIEGLVNEMSKLRAIYRWIVSQQIPLIIKPGEINKDSPIWFLYTIREKRASFSELFAVLCRRAHLPCVIIYGVAKSVAYDVGDKVTQKRLKNSWNAVFIEGEWRFVHPYWARQSVRGYDTGRWAVVECDEFHTDDSRTESKQTAMQTRNDFFFLTDPDKFITKCFPEDPSWQLLSKPLTKEEFEDLPFLQPAFYDLNLQVQSHSSCVIHTNKGRVELTLGLPAKMSKRYRFLYKLFIHRDWEAEGEYDQILLDRYLLHYVQDDVAMFEIRFPVNGVYKLEIHCRDKKKTLSSDWVCDYRIVCYEAMPDCNQLPVVPSIGWGVGSELENSGLECQTHSSALVNLDQETVTFMRFAIPKDKPVSVEAELLKIDMSRDELSEHITVEQDNEHALVQISPPTEGEYALQIFVKEEGAERRKNVCNFLMHRTQIVEDPELADIRNELIKATENGDVDGLSLWVERFIDKGMEDRGDLTRARKKLHLSKINRDLKEAISRKDLDFLERVLNSASDTSLKRQIGRLAEEADAMRSRLRRLKRLQHAILDLDAKTISEMRSYPKPPAAVHGVMAATFMLLGNREADLKKWSKIQALISKHGKDALKRRVAEFKISNVSPAVLTRVRAILSKYDMETIQIASIGAATFYQWALTMAREATDM